LSRTIAENRIAWRCRSAKTSRRTSGRSSFAWNSSAVFRCSGRMEGTALKYGSATRRARRVARSAASVRGSSASASPSAKKGTPFATNEYLTQCTKQGRVARLVHEVVFAFDLRASRLAVHAPPRPQRRIRPTHCSDVRGIAYRLSGAAITAIAKHETARSSPTEMCCRSGAEPRSELAPERSQGHPLPLFILVLPERPTIAGSTKHSPSC